MDQTESDSKVKRRGLVLAGGGAKGAYAFGCLVAMKRLGYNFEVITGTSVGALNAALWSTNSLSLGFKVWKNLSFDTTYPVRLAGRFSRSFIQLWSILHLIIQLFRATLNRETHSAEKPVALVLALTMTIISCSIFLYLGNSNSSLKTGLFPFAIFLIALPYGLYRGFLQKYDSKNMLIIGGPAIALTLSAPFEMFIPALIGSIVILSPIVHFLGLIYRHSLGRISPFSSNQFVFSSAPLRDTVSAIIRSKPFSCPTYATSAILRDRIDFRGQIEWEPIFGDPRYADEPMSIISKDFERRAVRPVRHRIWQPRYDDLSELEPQDAVDKLMSSAALPFGLVAPVDFFGFQHVDGGVVDNLPWHPLILHGLDELFLITLEPFQNDEDALNKMDITPKRWIIAELENYISPLAECIILPEEQEEMEERMRLDFDRFGHRYVEMIEQIRVPPLKTFYPLTKIGGFFDGTLRFDSAYARQLIRQGIKDTYARLANQPRPEIASSPTSNP